MSMNFKIVEVPVNEQRAATGVSRAVDAYETIHVCGETTDTWLGWARCVGGVWTLASTSRPLDSAGREALASKIASMLNARVQSC